MLLYFTSNKGVRTSNRLSHQIFGHIYKQVLKNICGNQLVGFGTLEHIENLKVKNSLMFLLLIIIVLTNACAKDQLENPSSANEKITIEDLLNSVDENFGEHDENFAKIIKENPIDKAMLFEEEKFLSSKTSDMLDFARKYLATWEDEMNSVYEKLKNVLGRDARKALIDSQKAWKKYRNEELLLLNEMYISTSGIGSIIPVVTSYKAVNFNRERTIELAHYYYVLTGNFSFNPY